MRPVHLRALAALSVTVLALGGCGDDDDAAGPVVPPVTVGTQGPVLPQTGGPPLGSDGGELTDLEGYRRRCERLDLTGARARVLYEAEKEMTRGDAETVTAAVTIDRKTPAEKILRRPGAVEEPGLVVSCLLQARLSVPEYEFDVDEEDWVERSLLTTDTARWSWHVTPKVGGDHTLVLHLRPIVKLREEGDRDLPVRAEEADVQQYETRVDVEVPWSQRPQETMSRLASTFKVAEGLVKALTALIVAILGLGTVLGIRRRKKRPES